MNGEQKITAGHRQRLAVVYLRPSSLAQVRDNTESTLRQYDLAETAIRLGWPPAQVIVIDADLGCSGRQAAARAGLRELVGRVCIGEVGIILVLEVSRLARCSADFARLLELARLADTLLADTLLADTDGVYDLQEFNDRLVLGIKSTISESELHLMAGRLHAARVSVAERGQLRCRLPIGYVYDDEGACVLDPDEQVRAAVTDVFAMFRQAGSAFGVVQAFRRRPFPRRVFGRAHAGQLQWGPLTSSRIQRMVANPTYAGAYVYGRRIDARQPQPDETTKTVTTRRPRDQWPVLIHDHHPAYLSWSTYLDNLQRQPADPGRQPHRRTCPTRAGTPGTVSGHHPVWLLRAGPADPLPPPVASPRRLRLRSDHLPPAHQHLPIHRRRLRRCDRGRPAPVRRDAC